MGAALDQSLADGIRKLRGRATLARIFALLVAVSSVATAAIILALNLGLSEAVAYSFEGVSLVDYLAMLHVLFLFASFILVGMWIYAAHANLHIADLPALQYSPGWSIGWYCIPIANLFKPFQAMRELWFASHGEVANYEQSAPGLLWIWWIGWLLSSFMGFGETYEVLDAIGIACQAMSAAALFVIMGNVTQAQPNMSVASTFE